MTTSAVILDISLGTDMVISLVLTSTVSAGFGVTNGVMRYVHRGTWTPSSVEKILTDYYDRAIVVIIMLLVGMLLSIVATAVSTRLRSKAINHHVFEGA